MAFARFWKGHAVLSFHMFCIEICVSGIRLLIVFLKNYFEFRSPFYSLQLGVLAISRRGWVIGS